MHVFNPFVHRWTRLLIAGIICIGITIGAVTPTRAAGETVKVWLTTSDLASKLSPQTDLQFSSTNSSTDTNVFVNDSGIRQTVDGFGASMTDASAYLIWNNPNKDDIMKKLFSPTDGIGMSFLRQPIGASDYIAGPNTSAYYTYDDNGGNPDPNLTNFTIQKDTAYVLPLVSSAISLNSKLKVLGTPWSPPAWMKTQNDLIGTKGGTLRTEYYDAYANYFVKYLQAYAAHNIPVYAITPQNEPTIVPDNYPGMPLSASDEINFIKNSLGPAISNSNLAVKPKILALDDNWNQEGYLRSIYADADASKYITGSAWHHYGGDPSSMSSVHKDFPDKEIYQTEGSPDCSGGHPPAYTFLHSMNNWSRTGVAWNIALRPDGGPWTPTGIGTSCTALVQIDPSNNSVNYTLNYYQIGHFSKFVTPGASVIEGQGDSNIDVASFKNPDDSKVVVAHNTTSSSKTLQISWGNEYFTYTLPADAIATFTWSGTESNLSGTIAGTDYFVAPGSRNEASTDGNIGGPQDVGYNDNGDYLGYHNVDLGSGVNTVNVRLATQSTSTTNSIEFHLDSTTGPLIGTLTPQSTGGWQNWATQTTSITGASGVHDLYLVFKGGSGIGNIHWFSFSTANLSGTISGTSYSDTLGSRNETCTDGGVGGPQDVGYNDNGGYLGYHNVDLGSGVNTVNVRFATQNPSTTNSIEFHLDSTTGPLIGTLTPQPTGGWQNWTTQTTSITGASGIHDVYLVFKGDSGIGNIHWFSFSNS